MNECITYLYGYYLNLLGNIFIVLHYNEPLIEPTPNHKCLYCGVGLLLFQSTNTKICIECHRVFVWDIDNYKKSIVTRTCSTSLLTNG